MEKFFNTTGPCNPEDHYMLSAKDRLVGVSLERNLKNKLYWVLHAPRQTGKTTFLQSWMREINSGEEAIACYVSVERCQGISEIETCIPAVCEAIRGFAAQFLAQQYIPPYPEVSPQSALSEILVSWAQLVSPKALIVLFDEVDVLVDAALVSFLRQLRSGFSARGVGKFPVSVVLVGMRDLRDYLIKSKDGAPVNPGSPFNIKESSASLANFSAEDVQRLIGQHSAETGQIFEEAAIAAIYELTRGQPWLVNALAKKCHWELCSHGETVTLSHILQAKELLIRERAVHLDSLAERLRDPSIRKIVGAIIAGHLDPTMAESREFELALDLGLVSLENGNPAIANPIYREVIPRVLTFGMQAAIPPVEFQWKKTDGTLDLKALLVAFQRFWRRHADSWEQKADYTEAFPHLLLMAFLQRVINGGGRIEREYAAGRGRVDLAVEYGGTWNVIEIKLVHPSDGRATTLEEGLEQVQRYSDLVTPLTSVALVIFNRTPAGREKSWDERISYEEVVVASARTVMVFGG